MLYVAVFFFVTQYNSSLSSFVPNHTIQLITIKLCTKLHNTTHHYQALYQITQYNSSLSSFVPTFRILSQVVAEKSLTEKNVHIYYIRVTEGKNDKLKKEGKMRISILIFIYTIYFAYLKVYTKFENTGTNRS